MSVFGQRQFMARARSVFPWDTFFDPKDYLGEFNRISKSNIGLITFKKYLAIVAKSTMFPELSRDRNSGAAEFFYFLDPTEKTKNTKTTLPKVESSSFTLPISEGALLQFISRVKDLCSSEKWYSCFTLWHKYSSHDFRELKSKTFASYMSLALRTNLWEGLSRRKGKGKVYKYYWPKDENESVTVTQVPQNGRMGASTKDSPPESSSGEHKPDYPGWIPTKEDPKTCSCGSWNPYEAKFCMNCGSTFGTCLKIVVQESVLDLRIMWKDEFLKDVERIKLHVKNLVCQKLLVFVDDMDGAGLLATVSLAKNQERKEMKKKGGS